jgi:hypothetical protein
MTIILKGYIIIGGLAGKLNNMKFMVLLRAHRPKIGHFFLYRRGRAQKAVLTDPSFCHYTPPAYNGNSISSSGLAVRFGDKIAALSSGQRVSIPHSQHHKSASKWILKKLPYKMYPKI